MNGLPLATLRALEGISAIHGDERTRVTGVTSDSRKVEPGDLFAAISGANVDGAKFIDGAIERGAVAVLATKVTTDRVPTVLVDDVRRWLGLIAHRVYGDPTLTLPTFGVTGTNGKTTVAYLVEGVLRHAGKHPALMGTVTLRGPAGEEAATHTTPEADQVARFAAKQRAHGATHFITEVTSHALDQGRVNGTHFQVAAFTNLTQDHLDYHQTMEAYGEAKARLFTDFAPAHSVICVDAPFGQQLAHRARSHVTRVATRPGVQAEIVAKSFRFSRSGISAEVTTPGGDIVLESPLFGAHNLENLLVTLGSCLALGLTLSEIVQALKVTQGAPGRMERVADPRDVLVLVDYAHTEDALRRALEALRPLTQGRLYVLCGCGGDRDRTKRAPMAETAIRLADVAILTSDNPRTEDPAAILQDMEVGAERTGVMRLSPGDLSSASRGYEAILDRATAISEVIQVAKRGDTVLIAGKGHETYQIVGTTKLPFDDRDEARRAIAQAGGS